MSDNDLNLESKGDIEVDRFVAKVYGDMEDENFSPTQKAMIVLIC
ncbi:MAG: hypothetical protein ACWGHO_02025 [Candidatus Moraniibacteriota bacterium]